MRRASSAASTSTSSNGAPRTGMPTGTPLITCTPSAVGTGWPLSSLRSLFIRQLPNMREWSGLRFFEIVFSIVSGRGR